MSPLDAVKIIQFLESFFQYLSLSLFIIFSVGLALRLIPLPSTKITASVKNQTKALEHQNIFKVWQKRVSSWFFVFCVTMMALTAVWAALPAIATRSAEALYEKVVSNTGNSIYIDLDVDESNFKAGLPTGDSQPLGVGRTQRAKQKNEAAKKRVTYNIKQVKFESIINEIVSDLGPSLSNANSVISYLAVLFLMFFFALDYVQAMIFR